MMPPALRALLRSVVRHPALALLVGAALVAGALLARPAPTAAILVATFLSAGACFAAIAVADRAQARTARLERALTARAREAESRTTQVLRAGEKVAADVERLKAGRQAASPSTAGADAVGEATWTRDGVFKGKYTARPLDDFLLSPAAAEWQAENPFEDEELALVRKRAMALGRWRYHHGVEELKGTTGFYEAYADRVDAMLEMLDAAMRTAGLEAAGHSFLDIGAAEGYVTNHLLDQGVDDIDAIELNADNIERIWLVRAIKGQKGGRIARVDLERADWARALGRHYDVTLALGVIYHMENPLLFARNLADITDRVALVESDTPVFPRNERFRGFGNLYLHRDQVTLQPGDIRYLTEMRPDRQALAEILLAAGFREVRAVPPSTEKRSHYFDNGAKSLLVAFK